MACPTYPRALRALCAHVPYVPYVSKRLTYPTCSTYATYPPALRALRAHVLKYILQTEKLKISVLMKLNEGLLTDVFKGAEF